jgi:hypothetical protein
MNLIQGKELIIGQCFLKIPKYKVFDGTNPHVFVALLSTCPRHDLDA